MIKQLFPILLLLVSCSDDEAKMTTKRASPICETPEFQVISDSKSCAIENGILVCEVLEIENTQFIDQSAYEYSPNICNYELGEQILFKNQSSTTFFTVVEV